MGKTINKSIDKITIIIMSIIVILVILDQLSKVLIINFGDITIISNVLKLHVDNNEDTTSVFTLIVQHIIVLGIIIKFIMSQNQFIETKMKLFLSLVLSGGISNLIDILIRGNIVNFINIKIGGVTLPILNFAYIFIIMGVILIAANFAIFTVKEMGNKKSEKVRC